MKSICTFVDVGTVNITIASESFDAFACVASVNVATGGIECAVMSCFLTFVDIETSFVAFTGSGAAICCRHLQSRVYIRIRSHLSCCGRGQTDSTIAGVTG